TTLAGSDAEFGSIQLARAQAQLRIAAERTERLQLQQPSAPAQRPAACPGSTAWLEPRLQRHAQAREPIGQLETRRRRGGGQPSQQRARLGGHVLLGGGPAEHAGASASTPERL